MNFKRNPVFIMVLFSINFFLISCTTMRTNYFLITNLEDEKKAELLFEQSKINYKIEILEKQNYSRINDIRTAYTDVLKLDPTLIEAEKQLGELDSFVEKRTGEYTKIIANLSKVEKRTRTQNYDYILAIQKITEIDSKNKDMKLLKKETAALREAEISLMIEELSDLHVSIMEDKNQKTVLPKLKTAHKLANSISSLDQKNKEVLLIKDDFNMKINEFVASDMNLAKEKLEQKKYYEAEEAILKAEKNLTTMTSEKSSQIQDLKYHIYFDWASNYYATAKYQSAGYRANQALAIYKTNEAFALKAKINKAANARDYDSEINDIISSVESLLAQEKPAEAMTIIQTNIPRMKKQPNINKLTEMKKTAATVVAQIYKEGIDRYTDEDYERAAQKFSTVVAFNKGYEQAQSYLDKSNTKIQALSGASGPR